MSASVSPSMLLLPWNRAFIDPCITAACLQWRNKFSDTGCKLCKKHFNHRCLTVTCLPCSISIRCRFSGKCFDNVIRKCHPHLISGSIWSLWGYETRNALTSVWICLSLELTMSNWGWDKYPKVISKTPDLTDCDGIYRSLFKLIHLITLWCYFIKKITMHLNNIGALWKVTFCALKPLKGNKVNSCIIFLRWLSVPRAKILVSARDVCKEDSTFGHCYVKACFCHCSVWTRLDHRKCFFVVMWCRLKSKKCTKVARGRNWLMTVVMSTLDWTNHCRTLYVVCCPIKA